tara:strand:- start:4061 stop:4321 length:261 start_codon:yes stop_codon:yes gene_type:complete
MVKTRTMRRKSLSRRHSYVRRLRKSPCRGKGRATCRRTSGCKYSSGMKRSFCRKNKNTKRRMKGGTSKYMGNSNMTGSPLDRALSA